MASGDRRSGRFADWNAFLGEFRRSFETTGAVAPSSRFLARAITAYPQRCPRPARFLEAGPGTGPFTDLLIRMLQPQDRLVLVELNDRFVEILTRRLRDDPVWAEKREQVAIVHGPAEDVPPTDRFDAIVCGLPFNNFDPELVDRLFRLFLDRRQPGGTFSFFEYLWIRSAKSLVVGSSERRRLSAVGQTIDRYRKDYEIARTRVGFNLPPAMVRHLQRPADA